METFVNLLESFPNDMRVDLGCRNLRVAEHHLYRPKVCTAFQQVSRERMAEDMRRDVLTNPCLICVFFQDFPEFHARDRPPPCGKEENFGRVQSPGLLKIGLHGVLSRNPKGNHSLFASLPDAAHEARIKIDPIEPKVDEFGDPKPRCV